MSSGVDEKAAGGDVEGDEEEDNDDDEDKSDGKGTKVEEQGRRKGRFRLEATMTCRR